MAILFNNNHPEFKLKKSSAIKSWLLKVITSQKRSCGKIAYYLVSDEELLKMNREFLKHDTYTDIITFDYSEGKQLNAEILISVDRVADNTFKLKTQFSDELHRVMVHGVLHLCGHKDKSVADRKKMRSMEDSCLKALKVQGRF